MIVWKGLSEFSRGLQSVVAAADMAARASVVEMAYTLERTAKENASGRPGPEVDTGALRRGIRVAPITRFGPAGHLGWSTMVGPTVIYSRRIELGYRGTDSLGRSYSAPAYPYFTPAYVVTAASAQEIYSRNFAAAMRRL